jgi:hypothetical protein
MNANPALKLKWNVHKVLAVQHDPLQIEQGGLGLYGQAGASALGAAGQQLDARAQQLAQSTGRLTPTEQSHRSRSLVCTRFSSDAARCSFRSIYEHLGPS